MEQLMASLLLSNRERLTLGESDRAGELLARRLLWKVVVDGRILRVVPE